MSVFGEAPALLAAWAAASSEMMGCAMPSSAVRDFADPDEYTAAIRATDARLTAVGGGAFAAKLIRIDLHTLWMQRFEERLPHVAHAANMRGRAIIEFGTGEGPAPVDGGIELDADTLIRFADNRTTMHYTRGPTSFATMSLPIDQLGVVGEALLGTDLKPPADTAAVRPPRSALARLRRLHAAASMLAENAPEILANPAAATALEHELVQAMIACFAASEARGESSASRRHRRVMRHFHELVEASVDERLHVVDLCTRLNVSDRTLRACCQEYLGMPAHRYLFMRQMTIARRMLLRADPASTTVTDVATANGFWESGGSPSRTAGCSANRPRPRCAGRPTCRLRAWPSGIGNCIAGPSRPSQDRMGWSNVSPRLGAGDAATIRSGEAASPQCPSLNSTATS